MESIFSILNKIQSFTSVRINTFFFLSCMLGAHGGEKNGIHFFNFIFSTYAQGVSTGVKKKWSRFFSTFIFQLLTIAPVLRTEDPAVSLGRATGSSEPPTDALRAPVGSILEGLHWGVDELLHPSEAH